MTGAYTSVSVSADRAHAIVAPVGDGTALTFLAHLAADDGAHASWSATIQGASASELWERLRPAVEELRAMAEAEPVRPWSVPVRVPYGDTERELRCLDCGGDWWRCACDPAPLDLECHDGGVECR